MFLKMENITKPSIIRLARRAGVKSVSEECIDIIRQMIENQLEQVLNAALIVNSEHQTKTLMASDVYDGLTLLGHNITPSSDLGTSTCNK